MDMHTEESIHKEKLIKDLYCELSSLVWIIKVNGMKKKEEIESHFTGFSVSKNGYVMTCAHGNWHLLNNLKIKARQLNGPFGFDCNVSTFHVKRRWDMCLLKVDLPDSEDTACVKLGSGKLEVDETVFFIGHPYEFVGSCVVGKVAYPCVDQPEKFGGFSTCFKYEIDTKIVTLPYRIMGLLFNGPYFQAIEGEAKKRNDVQEVQEFQKNLHPRLPIIQCTGYQAGGGSSGAPLFNMNGEVVGMVLLDLEGHQISVHVAAIKEYLKEELRDLEGDGQSSEPAAAKKKKRKP